MPPDSITNLVTTWQTGFAFDLQARRDRQPNRVHWRFGLGIRLPMHSTPPHGDAVSVSDRNQIQRPDEDFHLADSIHSQTHKPGYSRLRPNWLNWLPPVEIGGTGESAKAD